MHTPKLTANTHTHIHKVPHIAHHKPIHTHTIILIAVLPHKVLHKIPPRAHHKTLHTHIIIHIKIIKRQPVTPTRIYYAYKKLSQSTHLPHIRRNTLR